MFTAESHELGQPQGRSIKQELKLSGLKVPHAAGGRLWEFYVLRRVDWDDFPSDCFCKQVLQDYDFAAHGGRGHAGKASCHVTVDVRFPNLRNLAREKCDQMAVYNAFIAVKLMS